jgi:hypothetical protein
VAAYLASTLASLPGLDSEQTDLMPAVIRACGFPIDMSELEAV